MNQPTFYFDRNFGRRFPEALTHVAAPFGIEYHHNKTNKFAADTPDDEWLTMVGSRGWVVFSHDRRFHRDGPATMAIKQHGIACFYLWGGEATSWEKLRTFVRAYDKIIEAIQDTARPFIFDVSHAGRLTRINLG